MAKKNKAEIQTTWSEKMLERFIKHFLNPLSGMPFNIPFFIMEKVTSIDFSLNESKHECISYIGILPKKGLENVYFCLTDISQSLNKSWPSSEEHKDCIGYLELLNGIADSGDYQGAPVPMIRGFIRRGLGFFETVNNLLRDAKIFGWKHPICLNIQIIILKDINTGNILNTELGIETVDFYQQLSVFERGHFIKHL